MLVTKALSKEMTHLAFVPLAKEAARRSPVAEIRALKSIKVGKNGEPTHLIC
ncbi:hypothetical protein ACQKNB_11610 [Lysinibacillus xylanilyticus]|uniref:hypothetical protein n=1 Tax=Lysinibacillus xylanilyticus TaxID=582475 RepID=UPI003D00CA4F